MTVRVDWEVVRHRLKVFLDLLITKNIKPGGEKNELSESAAQQKPFRCPTITAGCVRHYGALLPCDDVKGDHQLLVTRNVKLSDKEPVRMKEPAVCPK
ncbi:hypothetical protein [Klebsiella pneumoniae]|uniref:hypothetical protein n=1 Tax=Klebsiella pneumoniae TaxID=573 RepID=UPI003D792F7C